MKRLLLMTAGGLVLATIASAGGGPSQEKLNKRLHGTYSAHANSTCQESDGGFGPPPQLAALGPTHTANQSGISTVTYDGNGNLTAEGDGLSIAINPTPQPGTPVTFPITKSHFTCQGVYQVNADNTYSVDYSCSGNTVSGIIPGLAFTLTGSHETGTMKKNELISASLDGNLEFTTTQYGTTTAICARHTNSFKIDNEDAD